MELLSNVEQESKLEAKAPRAMRKYEESEKSKKTVASMIERKDGEDTKKGAKKKGKSALLEKEKDKVVKVETENPVKMKATDSPKVNGASSELSNGGCVGELDEKTIQLNREKLFTKGKKVPTETAKPKSPEVTTKKGKSQRRWDNGGTAQESAILDRSRGKNDGDSGLNDSVYVDKSVVGRMAGNLKDIEAESTDDDEDDTEMEQGTKGEKKVSSEGTGKKGTSFGFLSGLRSLVGSKTLTATDIEPVLEKMRDHLIAKNVAADIADSLCKSVAKNLEGRVLGTFHTVTSTVKSALTESCIQILTPRRRIDILRDAMDARERGSPYVVVFCGVNGVGKSTNLAKICFWLIENGFRVLIAACDTFRAGAVEQLRTHCRKLDALHPQSADGRPMVKLYERGYGKDAAGIASEAISHARDQRFDVVLVDTAGRMQDNAPLMQALAKLIKVSPGCVSS
jgi:signal recognition particle receptor subunit alpha